MKQVVFILLLMLLPVKAITAGPLQEAAQELEQEKAQHYRDAIKDSLMTVARLKAQLAIAEKARDKLILQGADNWFLEHCVLGGGCGSSVIGMTISAIY